MTEAPIARWLRETRLRQSMPGSEEPWTQDYFLDRLAEDTGWRLVRPNYSKYETGKQVPKNDTLARFVRFWESRGEPGPDFTPPAAVAEDATDVVAAIKAQTRAIEANTEMLRTVLERLGGLTPAPAGGEALTAYAQRPSDAAETPQVPSQPPADRQEEVSR